MTEILRQAEETDRQEDALSGEDRGDELPEQLRTPEGRRRALAAAKRRIEERTQREITAEGNDGAEVDIDPERSFRRKGGRREWLTAWRIGSARRRRSRGIETLDCLTPPGG